MTGGHIAGHTCGRATTAEQRVEELEKVLKKTADALEALCNRVSEFDTRSWDFGRLIEQANAQDIALPAARAALSPQ